jgi:hypothetical protein
MNRTWIVFALLAAPAFAQQKPRPLVADDLDRTTTYEFRNVDRERGEQIFNLVRSMSSNWAILSYQRELGIVVIRTPQPDDRDKVIALFEKYDVPPPPKPEIEFTAYLVLATKPGAAPSWFAGKPPAAAPLPADLQSAVVQMKQTLADRTYSLSDTIVTAVSGSAEYDGILPGSAAHYYSLSYTDATVDRDGKTVRLHPFRFKLTAPCAAANGCPTTGITTDTAISEGQKLVLGKIAIQPPMQLPPLPAGTAGDLFVVLTVKIKEHHD